MKQYCRYCALCCLIGDDYVHCEAKQKQFGGAPARRVNKCEHFCFNEIDVFNLDKTYKPIEARKKKSDLGKQMQIKL